VHLPGDLFRAGSQELLLGDGTFEAAFGRDLAAVQRHGDAWTIHDREDPPVVLTPPFDATVVGVHRRGSGMAPELVLLEGDRRTLSFAGRSASRSLPPAAAPIVDVTMNAWRAQIAYATATGEVVIHSLHEEAPLARYVPTP
jgi:hypothetical protein